MSRSYLFSFLICLLSFVNNSAQEEISISKIESIPDNATINDIITKDSFVYVAASTGLYRINALSFETTQMSDISCDALSITSKNELFASFDRRYLENINTGSKTNYNEPGIVIRDLEKYKGKIWIASNKGILTMNPRTSEMTATKSARNSDLSSQNVEFLHADDQGQMWIGTDKGVTLINKKEKWKTYEKKLSMEAMHYNHEGLWLVSNKEMWVVDPYNRWYPAAIEKGLKEGKIRDITADSTGRLYMASDILVRYDPYEENIESYKETPALVSKQCTSVESDKDNRIWLGTANSGLYLIGFKKEAKEMDLSALCVVEKNIKCVGEKALVNLSIYGGVSPYNIQWNDNNSTDKKRSLSAGKYIVNVTDAEGKQTQASVDIQEIAGMKLRVLSSEAESRADARDGKAEILISGGTPPYKVAWANGERGNKADQLSNGINEVEVTDRNNCKLLSSIEIKGDLLLPELQIAKIKVGQKLQINNLFFTADSTDIQQESFKVLDEIFDFLSSNETVVIEIGGHTNNIPSDEYCDKLSTERAKSVANYLYQRGIAENRIAYKGYGKRKPIASNKSLAGRKKNQRVEITIIELAG